MSRKGFIVALELWHVDGQDGLLRRWLPLEPRRAGHVPTGECVKDRPRDGAAVELVALQARAVRWLSELRKADLYPYDGVKVSTAFWSFQQWYERILSHFDDAFFLPLQLGVKTLAPWDPQYRGYYDNAKRFEGDLSVCGGWSYHNVRFGGGVESRDPSGCG